MGGGGAPDPHRPGAHARGRAPGAPLGVGWVAMLRAVRHARGIAVAVAVGGVGAVLVAMAWPRPGMVGRRR